MCAFFLIKNWRVIFFLIGCLSHHKFFCNNGSWKCNADYHNTRRTTLCGRGFYGTSPTKLFIFYLLQRLIAEEGGWRFLWRFFNRWTSKSYKCTSGFILTMHRQWYKLCTKNSVYVFFIDLKELVHENRMHLLNFAL